MWCATMISYFIVGATPLDIQEPAADDGVEFATAADALSD